MNKISILIPCYNKTMFYPKLFKSLKSQTNKNFDIIFLNDASTDETQTILEQFKKDNENIFNIKIINFKKNKGLAAARNYLIKETQTEYFLFLDADDIFKKNAIEIFEKELKQKYYDIYIAKYKLKFWFFYIPNLLANFRFRKMKKLNNGKANNIIFLNSYINFAWNNLINKKWFLEQKINFLEGNNFEDFPVMYPLHLLNKKIHFINKYTYDYNLNLQGISKKNNPKKIENYARSIDYLFQNLENKNLLLKWKESKMEEKFLKNFFTYIFSCINVKKIIIDKNYLLSFLKMEEIIKKYNLEKKIFSYVKMNNFLVKYSLKKYKKIKEILQNGQK